MTEYHILKANSLERLEKGVEIMMSKGWEPCGSLAVDGYNCYQPMTRTRFRLRMIYCVIKRWITQL